MARYVIEPDVALALAAREAEIPSRHRLFAPTLLRSQVLAQLYVQVQRGELSRKDASRRLDYLRACRCACWAIACCSGWRGTLPRSSAGRTPSWRSTWP